MDFECQMNALSKMSRLSRQKANRNSPAPASMENIAIPPSYINNNQYATSRVWPSATIRGCYLHFKQALGRNLQAFDLVPEYKVLSSPVRRWFKTISALSFMYRR